MIGITRTETIHGNPGDKRILPAGLKVKLELATNLPVDSDIKFWASPLTLDSWPKDITEWCNVGVGLADADVEIIEA